MAHRNARTAARLVGAVLTASAVAVVGPAAVPASAAGVVQLGHSPTPTYATATAASTGPAELPRTDVRVVRVR
ncbi:hypothetical protein EEW87_015905 [Janibacter melonis]|uniref:Uncharacterized protein n=1 Tax=Janibacter melonis TaxID=262209 RepID=A0A5P8FPD4_9MICO|nr:hypothetical protein [Janibacter melonis]QFQ31499.2 hypothetical protein EEW87_015905 [Janibacter melonis]